MLDANAYWGTDSSLRLVPSARRRVASNGAPFAEQKAKFLSAGHSLLVNGFSLAALAAAAVYSAVC